MEMQSMMNNNNNYHQPPNSGAYGLPSGPGGPNRNPQSILDDCQALDRAISDLDAQLRDLQREQRREEPSPRTIAAMNDTIMDTYRKLGERVRKIKSLPESGSPRNAPQVGRVDRRLKTMINEFQRSESEYRRRMQEQQARQYMIVNPDATEEEVREAVEDPDTQVFAQAVCPYLSMLRFCCLRGIS